MKNELFLFYPPIRCALIYIDKLDHLNHPDDPGNPDHLDHIDNQDHLNHQINLNNLTNWPPRPTEPLWQPWIIKRFIMKINAEFALFTWSCSNNQLINETFTFKGCLLSPWSYQTSLASYFDESFTIEYPLLPVKYKKFLLGSFLVAKFDIIPE